MEMKDRIRHIMEQQHMSQQVFAEFIGLSPATLSSIFNGRTRPTLPIVEAIKKKIPSINTDWLLMGIGEMYSTDVTASTEGSEATATGDSMLDFDAATSVGAAQSSPSAGYSAVPQQTSGHSVRNTRLDFPVYDVKNVDKEPRKVTEIRVYYDDQTYETFVPAKSK